MMTRTATQMAAVVTGLLMVAIVGIHAHGAASSQGWILRLRAG